MDTPFWWHEDAADGVRVAFTSVRAGNLGTHVGDPAQALENRRRLEQHLGVAQGSVRYLHQVHSSRVLDASVTEPPGPGQPDPEADAWISPNGAQPLAVMGADCPPILFAGRTGGSVVTAAAHTGRPVCWAECWRTPSGLCALSRRSSANRARSPPGSAPGPVAGATRSPRRWWRRSRRTGQPSVPAPGGGRLLLTCAPRLGTSCPRPASKWWTPAAARWRMRPSSRIGALHSKVRHPGGSQG